MMLMPLPTSTSSSLYSPVYSRSHLSSSSDFPKRTLSTSSPSSSLSFSSPTYSRSKSRLKARRRRRAARFAMFAAYHYSVSEFPFSNTLRNNHSNNCNSLNNFSLQNCKSNQFYDRQISASTSLFTSPSSSLSYAISMPTINKKVYFTPSSHTPNVRIPRISTIKHPLEDDTSSSPLSSSPSALLLPPGRSSKLKSPTAPHSTPKFSFNKPLPFASLVSRFPFQFKNMLQFMSLIAGIQLSFPFALLCVAIQEIAWNSTPLALPFLCFSLVASILTFLCASASLVAIQCRQFDTLLITSALTVAASPCLVLLALAAFYPSEDTNVLVPESLFYLGVVSLITSGALAICTTGLLQLRSYTIADNCISSITQYQQPNSVSTYSRPQIAFYNQQRRRLQREKRRLARQAYLSLQSKSESSSTFSSPLLFSSNHRSRMLSPNAMHIQLTSIRN